MHEEYLASNPAVPYVCSRFGGIHLNWFFRYWHMVLVTRLPGFSPQVVVMAMEDVDAVERIKFFVGYGIQVGLTEN